MRAPLNVSALKPPLSLAEKAALQAFKQERESGSKLIRKAEAAPSKKRSGKAKAKLGDVVATIVVAVSNAIARSPDQATILAVRIGIDGRTAERVTKDPRGDRMPTFGCHRGCGAWL
jgi:hypothetical protein